MTDANSELHGWLSEAGPRARVLSVDPQRGERVAAALGVSDKAMLHAVATQVGAVLVDGCIRVLGGGPEGRRADLASWNGLGETRELEPTPGVFIVGFDVFGGVFAMDGGALGGTERGAMHYFGPDLLKWEPLGGGYSAWLQWLLTDPHDVGGFYGGLVWEGWQREVEAAGLDEAIHAYPPPYTLEGKDPARVSRKVLPAREVVGAMFATARQLDGRDIPGPR